MATATSTFNATDGDAYERLMGRWSRVLARPFVDFVGLAPGERVLDVGCGTGHLAFTLAARAEVQAVRGVDLAAVYVEHARRHNTDPRVSFDVADACALPFPDGQFDRVMSLLLLHFVPDTAAAVAQMRRVAKPGGTVAAAVWDVRGGFMSNRLFWDTAAAIDPKAIERRARNFTRPMTRPGELARAWRDGGLQDVQETVLVMRMEYADFDDFWSPYLGHEGPGAEYVATLDEAGRERLKQALRAAYVDGEPDGPRSYAGLAWAVKGTVPR